MPTDLPTSTVTEAEIRSQPDSWRLAARADSHAAGVLPNAGERVAVVGCGTSYYMARAYARLREDAGAGETDAYLASMLPRARRYDRVLAISRSGTTSDVVELLAALAGTVPTAALVAVADSPVTRLSDAALALDFADERSVVQTRFATSVLAVLRASLGHDLDALAHQAARALDEPVPADPATHDHVVFLGADWADSLAQEAALKVLEASGRRAEAYHANEFLHGPVAACGPRSLVWALTGVPGQVVESVTGTGAQLRVADLDPMAELVRVHRYMLAAASRAGRDPDRPPHLHRSVVTAGS